MTGYHLTTLADLFQLFVFLNENGQNKTAVEAKWHVLKATPRERCLTKQFSHGNYSSSMTESFHQENERKINLYVSNTVNWRGLFKLWIALHVSIR